MKEKNIYWPSLSFITLALRGASLFSRFLLIFSLARLFSVKEMGEYGFMVATVEFLAFSLGLEFYAHVNREIIRYPTDKWSKLIRDQLVFHALTYISFAIIIAVLIGVGLLQTNKAIWLISIITVEYLAQESYRILVATSHPSLAALLHFIRSAIWIYPVITILWLFPEARNLSIVWIGWICGSAASLLIPYLAFRQLEWSGISKVGVDWKWISKGIKAALIFFASSMFIRATYFFDRLILEMMHGFASVGVYHFFLSIANIITIFVEAGVIIHHYPQLVKSFYSEPKDNIYSTIRSFSITLAVTLIITTSIMVFAIFPYLDLINQNNYQENLAVFWWLLAAMVIWCISFLPHYILYAKGHDKHIMVASSCHLAIFLIAALPLAYFYSAIGMAIATFIGSLSTLLIKIFLVLKSWPHYY